MTRLLSLLMLSACGEIEVEAVTGASCLDRPEHPVCAREVWPNDLSDTNSDRWLAAQHDGLREMRPRVLVLDYHNTVSVEQTRQVALRQIDALAEGSRYHGYADSNAAAFLRYQLLPVVDFTDRPPPSEWDHPSSTRVPLDSAGRFDLGALFAPSFVAQLGIVDPSAQDAPLGICALFERGLIHELWLAIGDVAREPTLMVECKPGSQSADCRAFPACSVTMRIAHLSPLRGVGCDLQVRGRSIPESVEYLKTNGSRFFRQGARGCGTSELAPNATRMWEFQNTTPVTATCAHYGLGDGPDGQDLAESYSYATVEPLAARFPDCGGAWQIYWRQNLPGLGNTARAVDGTPMKNWWPFLFY